MTTTTDDRELLRTLAQACGWTCTQGNVFATEGYWVTDKEDSVTGASFGRTPDEAWKHAEFPDWLNSVDAAMGLPWPRRDGAISYRLVIDIGPDGIADVELQKFEDYTDPSGREFTEEVTDWSAAETDLAYALSETFAQWWKEAHHE